MRVLGGGEDSVGGRLALTRVYLNIGMFHEYWRQTGNLLIGVRAQSPFRLDTLHENSSYWNVSQFRAQNMAEYLTYASGPLRLADAPGGRDYLSTDAAQIRRGRAHFVTHCIVCHSTRQPDRFWTDPGNWQRWVRDPQYLQEAAALAARDDFRIANFLATDVRYSVAEIGINTARFLNDNARTDRVWRDFSSAEYKNQRVLGDELKLAHPYDPSRTFPYRFNGRTGPGRVRPLSLMNIWATAPFLHNNSVGRYPAGHDPGDYPADEAADVSVAGRMRVFNDSIEALLNLRERKGYDSIVRTTVDTRFEFPRVVLIDFVRQQLGSGWLVTLAVALAVVAALGVALIALSLRRLARGGLGRLVAAVGVVFGLFVFIATAHVAFQGEHQAGYIPAGTPVSLIANFNGPSWVANADNAGLLRDIAWDLGKVWLFRLPSLNDPRVPHLVENLIALNKDPDLVLDRGHDFGGKDVYAPDGSIALPALGESERRDLIEYLKTF
jgi:mono/diheme cytochrome c family protein